MSKVLERATAHFRTRISNEMTQVYVPEWDSKIWFKQINTLKEESKLVELHQQGKTVEALVETLIMKSRNEDGTKMFGIADKMVFMNEVDPQVLIRVVGEMNQQQTIDSDIKDTEKN